jgi:hypothetical protein
MEACVDVGATKMRVAFQGEPGAFSEAAAVQLLGSEITTVPRPTFDAVFRAMADGSADALLVPVGTRWHAPLYACTTECWKMR